MIQFETSITLVGRHWRISSYSIVSVSCDGGNIIRTSKLRKGVVNMRLFGSSISSNVVVGPREGNSCLGCRRMHFSAKPVPSMWTALK